MAIIEWLDGKGFRAYIEQRGIFYPTFLDFVANRKKYKASTLFLAVLIIAWVAYFYFFFFWTAANMNIPAFSLMTMTRDDFCRLGLEHVFDAYVIVFSVFSLMAIVTFAYIIYCFFPGLTFFYTKKERDFTKTIKLVQNFGKICHICGKICYYSWT